MSGKNISKISLWAN